MTSAEASALATRRHVLAREKAAQGLRTAIEAEFGVEGLTPEDAWGAVISAQAILSTRIEEGHASTQAAKLVGGASGMMSTDRTTIQDQRKQTVVIVGDGQAGKYLTELGIGQLSATDVAASSSEEVAHEDAPHEDSTQDEETRI